MSITIGNGITIGAGITTYSLVTSGLVFALDSGNPTSYPGTGNVWYDLAGSNNATLPNGATYSSSNGGILTFDRTSQQSAHAGDLGGALTTFTAETWVNLNAVDNTAGNATCTITEVYSSTPINYAISNGLSGNPNVWQGGYFDGGAWRLAGTFIPTANIWYCMAVTYDGTDVKFYVDGAVNDTVASAVTPGSSGLGMHIGERWDAPFFPLSFLDGSVPIVRLYNRALSASEISQNFNANRSRFGL